MVQIDAVQRLAAALFVDWAFDLKAHPQHIKLLKLLNLSQYVLCGAKSVLAPSVYAGDVIVVENKF